MRQRWQRIPAIELPTRSARQQSRRSAWGSSGVRRVAA